MQDELDLLHVLSRGRIGQIIGLPFRTEGHYADIGLETHIGDVKIVAAGEDLSSGEEIFYLDLEVFDPATSWIDDAGIPAWPAHAGNRRWHAIGLVNALARDEAAGALDASRELKLFRRVDRSDKSPAKGLLQSAAAITFEDRRSSAVLAIYASPRLVCSVELTWDRARVSEIVSSLEEFRLE